MGCFYSPTCREGKFSETLIQRGETLSNRTGAKHDLRFDRTGFFMHLATRLDGYAVRHSGPKENLRSHERRCDGSCGSIGGLLYLSVLSVDSLQA